MMITGLDDPVEIYDVMLLLIDNVTDNNSPVSGNGLGVDDGCDLVIVSGACDGGREEVVKLQAAVSVIAETQLKVTVLLLAR